MAPALRPPLLNVVRLSCIGFQIHIYLNISIFLIFSLASKRRPLHALCTHLSQLTEQISPPQTSGRMTLPASSTCAAKPDGWIGDLTRATCSQQIDKSASVLHLPPVSRFPWRSWVYIASYGSDQHCTMGCCGPWAHQACRGEGWTHRDVHNQLRFLVDGSPDANTSIARSYIHVPQFGVHADKRTGFTTHSRQNPLR